LIAEDASAPKIVENDARVIFQKPSIVENDIGLLVARKFTGLFQRAKISERATKI